MTLQEIRDKMDRIKSDISRKEGERTGVLEALKKDFSVNTLDEAYDMFDDLKKQVEEKKKEKEKLMATVTKQLEQYGY